MKKAIFLTLAFFFAASDANAAVTIFLDPDSVSANYKDTFIMNVRIATDGECINVIESVIRFNPAVLRAIDYGTGQSLISLWAEPPKIDQKQGTISFSGGIPGGYCGRVIGDPGLTNILGKLVFTSAEALSKDALPVSTRVDSASTTVYMNDGAGTIADTAFFGSNVSISWKGAAVTNAWLDEVRKDTIAPELFSVEIARDPNIHGGKYFAVWSTMDKQSGIDHYEAFETNPWKFGFFEMTDKVAYWSPAESPYILKDQNLRSKIMIKAVDKMGNERIVEINPRTSVIPMIQNEWLGATFLLAFLVFFGGFVYFKKRKSRQVLNSL